MNAWLPLPLAAWAVVASVGTFAWLKAPEGVPVAAAEALRPAESGRVAIAVRGPDGPHYLTFRVRYRPREGRTDPVPVEAAVRDGLLDLARPDSALSRPRGWQRALRGALARMKEPLGLVTLEPVEPRRAAAID